MIVLGCGYFLGGFGLGSLLGGSKDLLEKATAGTTGLLDKATAGTTGLFDKASSALFDTYVLLLPSSSYFVIHFTRFFLVPIFERVSCLTTLDLSLASFLPPTMSRLKFF